MSKFTINMMNGSTILVDTDIPEEDKLKAFSNKLNIIWLWRMDELNLTLRDSVPYDLIIDFEKLGAPCWPCHTGVFTVPVKLAVKLNIPLIILMLSLD